MRGKSPSSSSAALASLYGATSQSAGSLQMRTHLQQPRDRMRLGAAPTMPGKGPTNMRGEVLAAELRASLRRQNEVWRSTLILNPVENFPFGADLAVVSGLGHGLYNSDRDRTRDERLDADILFAGRAEVARDCRTMYAAWAEALGAADATLRPLSGLNAHEAFLMSATRAGQTVLLLPVRAGGHVSGPAITDRLGLKVIDMVVNDEAMAVDMTRTLEVCERTRPDFVLVDRSEGLVVEDFSALTKIGAQSIFDASQFLSQVLTGDHPNPLQAGFDFLLSSVHKNFPGPQKALLATREMTDTWAKVLRGASAYVSNMHFCSIYAATLTLARSEWLRRYAKQMLACATSLEAALAGYGVPVVRRPDDAIPTHHVWIREGSRDDAMKVYEALEACLILTNYRKLPYSLGQGLRLGLSAAVRVGLEEADVPRLAELVAEIRRNGPTSLLQSEARAFNRLIWDRFEP